MRLTSLLLGSYTLALCISTHVVGQRVWLYAFVSADHGGDALFPHFINHYHQLGMTYRRMLVLVHHTPNMYPREGLEKILGICQGYGLECRLWEERFTPEGQYEEHLKMLRDFVFDPYDWVVYADVNEFQDWQGPIKYEVEKANRNRAYFITGPRIQRLGADYSIVNIPKVGLGNEDGEETIFERFPLRCPSPHIVSQYTDPNSLPATASKATPVRHHPSNKVVAFRNSMRVTRLRDTVIAPDDAEVYLGDCSDVGAPEECPRSTLDREEGLRDLYHLTPYYTFSNQYRYRSTPPHDEISVKISLWHPVEWAGMQVPIHTVDWAREGILKHWEWLDRYRGDCDLDDVEKQCTPLLPSWRERAELYNQARRESRVQVHVGSEDESCDLGDLIGLQTNTSYSGLAWEEFETKLKVVSKVRNTKKGDSRTRLESMAKKTVLA